VGDAFSLYVKHRHTHQWGGRSILVL
jgi:hypothetical protein